MKNMQAKSGLKVLPQVFVNGEFKGVRFLQSQNHHINIFTFHVVVYIKIQDFDAMEAANEDGKFRELLNQPAV